MPLYSYSRIGCFEQCPRKYKFKYIEKPKIDIPVGVEAFLGNMVHKTLEQCYKLAQRGKVMVLDELLAYYERIWKENLPENLKIVRDEMAADDYFGIGQKALRVYHDRYYPYDREITLDLERKVILALDADGKYKLQGFIDRLARDSSGRLRIHDYKTSSSLPTQQEVDTDSQLALYQIAVEEMWPDNNGIELVWHYVQFDTTLISHRDANQLKELKKKYIDRIKKIEAAVRLNNFPTSETGLCNWCEYYPICPAKGGEGAIVESAQRELESYSETELALLVDRYVKLDEQKKKIEAEIKRIKPELARHGEVGSGKLLKGSGNWGVMVTLSNIYKLPTRSSDKGKFDIIDELIKQAGLYPDYSTLDMPALQKALSEGQLPEALNKELQKYSSLAVREMVKVKKVK